MTGQGGQRHSSNILTCTAGGPYCDSEDSESAGCSWNAAWPKQSQPVARCTLPVFVFLSGLTTWQGGGAGFCVEFRDRFCAQLLSFLVFSHWDIWGWAPSTFAGLGGRWWKNETGLQSTFPQQMIPPAWMCSPKWTITLIRVCGKETETSIFSPLRESPHNDSIAYSLLWQPTSVFLPGESQGRGSPVGCRLWGRTESDTAEVT